MREIKFRGKRIDSMEWIYGSLVGIDDIAVIVDHRDFSWNPHTDVNAFWFDMENNEVDPNTVGQYTGLKDKNGKEIYEGDIIECISSNGASIKHYVEFREKEGCYIQYIIDKDLPRYLADGGRIYQSYIDKFGKYIIGNIHDNPELLETE